LVIVVMTGGIDASRSVLDLVVAIFRANGAIIANGDRLVADLGLTSALWQVLDALDRANGSRSVADIARSMGLTRQSVQRSVDRLVEQGLAGFATNPAHKRAQLVQLTPDGEQAVHAIQDRVARSVAQTLESLAATEIEAARRVLVAFTDEQLRQARENS
jgi:DNA-binding MarR family transcriptional regulator